MSPWKFPGHELVMRYVTAHAPGGWRLASVLASVSVLVSVSALVSALVLALVSALVLASVSALASVSRFPKRLRSPCKPAWLDS